MHFQFLSEQWEGSSPQTPPLERHCNTPYYVYHNYSDGLTESSGLGSRDNDYIKS